MSNNSALLQQAKQTEVNTDHSTPTKGGPRIPTEGTHPARLVGYVELGTHPQPDYQGKAKDPVMEVQLTFEVFGKDNTDEIEVDGKKKTVGRMLRPLPITMKVNERAKFYKMFKDMDYGRGIDHMSKMLNDVFRVSIEHGVSKGGNPYAKLVGIQGPLIEKFDDMGNVESTIDITDKVQPASYDLQLFIVEKPTFEQWQSIFIDGTYTKKTKNDETGEEVEEEVSKNFIQQKIQSSLDWEGSAMQTLLLGLDEEADEPKEEPKKKPAKKAEKAEKSEPESEVSDEDDEAAALEELGL